MIGGHFRVNFSNISRIDKYVISYMMLYNSAPENLMRPISFVRLVGTLKVRKPLWPPLGRSILACDRWGNFRCNFSNISKIDKFGISYMMLYYSAPEIPRRTISFVHFVGTL